MDFTERQFFGRHLRNIHKRSLFDFPETAAKPPQDPATPLPPLTNASAMMDPKPVILEAEMPIPAAFEPRPDGRRRHYGDEGRFSCPICPLTYKTKGILGAHVRKIHGQSLRDFDSPRPHGPVSKHVRSVGRPKKIATNGFPEVAVPNTDVSAVDLLNVLKQKRQSLSDTLAQVDEMIKLSERIVYAQ
jgi:hypothetical protein